MTPCLYTWCFTAWHRYGGSDVVPVRTSMGRPRFIEPRQARAMPVIDELIPYGLLKVDPEAEFARRYRVRLETHGVAVIKRRIAEIHAIYQRPLVLLCFEKLDGSVPGEFCHRRVFADWWQEKTGEEILEYEPQWEPIAPPPEPAQAKLF